VAGVRGRRSAASTAMITDQAALTDIQASWTSLRQNQAKVETSVAAAMGFGGMGVMFVVDYLHNLMLIYALGVLADALQQLRSEGLFQARASKLGSLMQESRPHLPWRDFPLVNEGRQKRDDIAHKMAVVSGSDRSRYIDAVEAELIAWRILKRRVTATFVIDQKTNE